MAKTAREQHSMEVHARFHEDPDSPLQHLIMGVDMLRFGREQYEAAIEYAKSKGWSDQRINDVLRREADILDIITGG